MSKDNSMNRGRSDQTERLWDLFADAIVSSYMVTGPLNTRSGRDLEKNAIVFVYNLLDLLLIAIPEGIDLLLSVLGTSKALSTASGGVVDLSEPNAGQRGIALDETGQVRIIPLSPRDSDPKCGQILSEVLGRARSLARSQGIDIRPDPIAVALRLLSKGSHRSTAPHATDEEPLSSTDETGCDAQVLEGVVQNLARSLGATLLEAHDGYELVLRYWAEDGPVNVAINRDFRPPSARWRPLVSGVFETGFVRWGHDRHVAAIAIPCHFLGVPWLVACRTASGITTRVGAQWWAYTNYRAQSFLNASIRQTAIAALASEMHRLLRATTEERQGVGAALQAARRAWSSLPRVYPVPLPILRSITEHSTEVPREETLVIAGQRCVVVFSESPNPFFPSPAIPLMGGQVSFGPIDAELAKRRFLLPAQRDYYQEEAEALERIARSAYAVGHPLMHRLHGARQAMNHVGVALRRNDIAEAQSLFGSAYDDVAACTRVAELMHLISNVLKFGPDNLDHHECSRFYEYEEPFVLEKCLMQCHQICSRLRRDVVLEPINWWRAARNLEIHPGWIHACQGKARFFDTLYTELLFECVLNAASHGDKPRCLMGLSYEEKPDTQEGNTGPALIISNRCGSRPLDSPDGTWLPWGSASRHEGGLRLLADCLRITRAGSIEVSQVHRGGRWWFLVRLQLWGLQESSS
jgi:hypothetical protein